MISFIRKLFATPYECCMELIPGFGCYISIDQTARDSVSGFKQFFEKNHFMIGHCMFDTDWDKEIILEEIVKKLIAIYNFNLTDENIIIVYKDHDKIYLPNGQYVILRQRGIFVYDKSKLKVFY